MRLRESGSIVSLGRIDNLNTIRMNIDDGTALAGIVLFVHELSGDEWTKP
jgi:hypothetical protein